MVLPTSSESELYQISFHDKQAISISCNSRTHFTPLGIDRFLTLPEHLRPAGAKEMETLLYWMRGFLALPHPFLGRPGPVCPFVPSLLQKQALYVCVMFESPRAELLEAHRQLNLTLIDSPTNPHARLSTIIALYPNATFHDLEDIQADKQQCFLESGLMLGGLHKAVERKGLHNKNIITRRSPVPLLASHAIFPGDLVFLSEKESHFRAYQKCITREQVPSALVALYDSVERSFAKAP
jgi:hypothetical protein